ncbi:4070_t:CDS:2, partial [Entrophospora sp. SA101]
MLQGKIKSLKGELDLFQKESSKKESEISSLKSNLAELERNKKDLISKVSELEHLKLVTISRNLSNQVKLPSGEAKLRTSDSPIIGGGDEGQSTIAPTIKNIANSDVISAVDKPKLNFSKFLKRRNNMDQTEKIDTPKSSDTIIKANISESTNVEFPTNASQASEMINFSGGAISEILPVRGGEVVPIVAGNEKKMQSKLFELVDFLDPILQYLANDKALYPTLYFNRFWYCIAGQILWKHIELDYILSDKINGIIQSCPNIVYLNFNAIGRLAISDTAIINIAHEYPNLLRLDLFECYISDTAIRAIACSCHNLQHLDLGLYMEIQLKEQCWEEEGRQFSNYRDTDDYKKYIERMRFLDGECHKFYYELVEVEKCMLQNKLIRRRERGDVLKRIKHVNSEDWLHPWLECEIEEMINPIDYELNIFLDSN